MRDYPDALWEMWDPVLLGTKNQDSSASAA